MHTHSSTQNSCRPFCQQLAHRYNWRLLDLQTWSTRATAHHLAARSEKGRRRACLRVYAETLHSACQNPVTREQAYGELYNYLWGQAQWCERNPELANDAAQEAIILVQRSFVDGDLKPCKNPDAFLYFTDLKVRDALKMLRRRYQVQEEIPESDLADLENGSGPITRQADDGPLSVEKERWWQETIRTTALVPLNCLDELWGSTRLHSQLTAVVATYMDQGDDEEIAQRLDTSAKNVEVLRSRGLKNVRKRFAQQIATQQTEFNEWL